MEGQESLNPPTNVDGQAAVDDKIVVVDQGVNSFLDDFEQSKIIRKLPFSIEKVDGRDLEFTFLIAKIAYFIPILLLTRIDFSSNESTGVVAAIGGAIEKTESIVMVIVALILTVEIIFAIAMFVLTSKACLMFYAIALLCKMIALVVCFIHVLIHSFGIIILLATFLCLVIHFAIDVVHIFYLRNSVKKIDQLPPREDEKTLENMVNSNL